MTLFWGLREHLPIIPHVWDGARRPPGDAVSCASLTDAVLGVVVDDLLEPRIHGLDPPGEGEADAEVSAEVDQYSPLGEPVKKAGAEIQASGNFFNYLYLNCFFFLS